MYVQSSQPPLPEAAIEKLVENGKKLFGWRVVGAVPALIVVELQFTVIPDSDKQTKDQFEQRMATFALMLCASGYQVVEYSIDQRKAGQPWAAFHVQTPQYRLRKPTRRHQIKVIE